MKIGEKRVYDRDVGAFESDATSSLILGQSMQPQAIEYYVIGCTVKQNEIVDRARKCATRHFQANQPVIVRSRSEDDGTTA